MKGTPRNNGRLHDAELVRSLLKDALGRTKLSREEIGAAMDKKLGKRLTMRNLNSWVAPSRHDRMLPLEYVIALCEVLGDYKLLAGIVSRAGFRMIGPDEEKLIHLGRAVVAKVRAEKVLAGMDL